MDRIERITTTKIEIVHHFECDMCGKEIGSVMEYEDGYYEELGMLRKSIFMNDVEYRYEKTLCNKCREVIISKIVMSLKDLGFEEDEM